ncbi:MAG: BTAD domain-containing putative transcriptional regulator, partial [Fimbriimonadales bacterium]
MKWYIRLFGVLTLERDTLVINRFRTAKTGWLVAYLALTPPHRFSREFLADLLWGDLAPDRARHSLNLALSWLRNALDMPDLPAGALLQTNRTSVGLNPAHFTTDVMQFEQAVMAAQGSEDETTGRPLLERAVALYRGECLAGCYEPWAVEAAAHYHAACLRTLGRLASLSDHDAQLHWLHRILHLEPLDWASTEQLVRAYLRKGQMRLARQVCEQYELHWRRLHGSAPPPHLEILKSECAAPPPSTP